MEAADIGTQIQWKALLAKHTILFRATVHDMDTAELVKNENDLLYKGLTDFCELHPEFKPFLPERYPIKQCLCEANSNYSFMNPCIIS